MSDWQTEASEVVHETPWFKVRRDQVRNHRGKQLTYTTIQALNPSVFIVAANPAGEILILQNYRYPISKTLWEIPAGGSDGQQPLAAAKRELLEEAGMASEDWTQLGTFYQAVGTSNMPLIVFLARNVRKVAEPSEETEEISERCFKSFEQIERMIAAGNFQDAPALTALFAAKVHGI